MMALIGKYTKFLIFMFFSSCVYGQDVGAQISIESSNFSVSNWTTEHGLPQNCVKDILEDENGFIWIATFDGLARFDGYQYTIFNKSSVEEMTSSAILSMCKDVKGNIWFSTEHEIICYRNNSFQRFELPEKGLFTIHSNLKEIYIRSTFSIYSLIKNEFTLLHSAKSPKHLILGLVFIDNRPIYFEQDKLYWLEDDSPYCEGEYVQAGKGYVKSADGENVYKLAKNGPVLFYKSEKPSPYSQGRSFSFEDQSTVLMKNGLVTVTDSNGRVILNTSLSQLKTSSIQSVWKSKNGIIWMGSGNNGLFMLYPKRFNTISSLHPNILRTGSFVYQSPDSTIWMDGDCGTLYNTIDRGQTIQSSTFLGCPWSMIVDHKGQQWTLTMTRGIKKGAGEYLKYNDLDKIPFSYSLYETSDNRLFVSTGSGVYEVISDSLVRIKNSNSLGIVYSFYENKVGELLFCASKGVGKIIKNRAIKLNILNRELDVRSIHQDRDLNYWIGTAGDGLFWFNGDQLKPIKAKNQVLSKDVWTILEDDRGFLWLNSNNGIYRVRKKDLVDYGNGVVSKLHTVRFGSIDGLVNPEGNSRTQNKGFFDFEGNLWFSTVAGPAFINPLSINISSFANPIIIESVAIDGEKIVDFRSIVINANQSKIQFKFTQANFLDTRHLGYEYNISGFDNAWVSIESSRSLILAGLPAGDYTLRIRQTGTGIETSINFDVKVYFYETNLFIMGVSILGTILVLFILFRIWKKQRHVSRKMQFMDHQLKTLKVQALQSQMNPHFIFNCLNSIQSLYLIGERDKANLYMTSFSKLLRMILVHVESKNITLEQEIKMYNAYIPLESLQLNDSFTYSISIDPLINSGTTYIPSMIAQTFIENAIKHGLGPLKDQKGELKIKISQTTDEIVILIEDNGIGIKKSLEFKKGITLDYESRGTALTEERIELMNSLNDLGIKVLIENLNNGMGASGTIVQLFFPKNITNEDNNNR